MRPYIPEDAPFSSEQRAWLNGLLAGLFLDLPKEPSAPQPLLDFAIFFATQGGTAERLARKLSKQLRAAGHAAAVESVENLTSDLLTSKELAIFFASTYGEGDPPDSAVAFRDHLFAENAPALNGMRYAVFSLGDRSYENFCKFGSDLDERLASLGARRLLARVDSDVDVDAAFESWQPRLISAVTDQSSPATTPASTGPIAPPKSQTRNRDNPFFAKV